MVDFPSYIPFPLPDVPDIIEVSNPYGEAVVGNMLYVTDGGRQRYIPPCNTAAVYTALGDKEQAFTFLEKSLPDHDPRLSFLKIDPRRDHPLHGDKR